MSIENTAANIRGGNNDNAFTVGDFIAIYPQFGEVPAAVLDMYVEQGNKNILQSRWHSQWKLAISLYIAHYVTLWARTSANEPLSNAEIGVKGESKGAVMSKSIDGVSISYGQSSADSDLTGWGSYKDTLFGQQFATMARLKGLGNMYVL